MDNKITLQTKRLYVLYAVGFLLIFGYSFARPCIDSIFLEHYSSSQLPAAWLITALVSVFVIAGYNKINQKYAILDLYGRLSILSAISLAVLLSSYLLGFVPAIFILYIWKEIYMVVLTETYWSFADMVFSTHTAKNTYGWAMAISSLGGVLGNLVVGPAAQALSSSQALWVLFALLLGGSAITFFARNLSDEKPDYKKQLDKKGAKIGLGLKTLWHSKYLVPLAFLICIVQVVTGLIDFSFNDLLQENYSNTEMRTVVLGQLHAAVNVFGIAIQVATGLILKVFGIPNTFKSIPFLLASFMFAFVLLPKFAIMVALKISNKALDYSLMRGVKEMLYIPLNREEKTQGKGIIDIFMYRIARGLSSVMLMTLVALGLQDYVVELALVLVVAWFWLAVMVTKRYSKLMDTKDA